MPLNRVWSDDDAIDFDLLMGFVLRTYTGTDAAFEGKPAYALEYGPLLMAVVGQVAPPPLAVAPETLVSRLKPVANQRLHFALEGDNEYRYKPD